MPSKVSTVPGGASLAGDPCVYGLKQSPDRVECEETAVPVTGVEDPGCEL